MFRSKDGGATWEKILYRDDHSGAVDLVFDPHNPNVLFAAIWDVNRTPWGLTSGGPGSGLFKTTDGGDHWTEITRNPGLPSGIIGKIGVAVSGADSNRVYAIVENDNGGALRLRRRRRHLEAHQRRAQRAPARLLLHAACTPTPRPKTPSTRSTPAFFKSTDGGKTFRTLQAPHGDHHDLWIDPDNPLRMIDSNDGGGTVSVNGGQTWTGQQYPTAQLYHVAVTNEIPYHVCGAQQDSSTICTPEHRAAADAVAEARRRPTPTARAAARAATSPPIRAIPISSTPAARARC